MVIRQARVLVAEVSLASGQATLECFSHWASTMPAAKMRASVSPLHKP